MDRRQALALSAAWLGTALIGADAFLSGCKNAPATTGLFSAADIALMDEIGETILPETADAPGAKAAQIGAFMEAIVTDCYDEKEQAIFTAGLQQLHTASKAQFGGDFMAIQPQERFDLLASLDKTAAGQAEDAPPHYFRLLKELTLWGYFSSEPGVTKALRHNPIPGRFDGCVPYTEGEKAWY